MPYTLVSAPNNRLNFSANDIAFVITAIPNAGWANYRMEGTLTVRNSANVTIATLKTVLYPDASNTVAFRFEEALQQIMRTYDLPTPGVEAVTKCTKNFLTFSFRYIELYDGQVLFAPTITDQYTVIKGGFPFQQFTGQDKTLLYLKNTKRFLTWRPDTIGENRKCVTSTMDHYLYFLCQQNYTTLTVRITPVGSPYSVNFYTTSGVYGNVLTIPCRATIFFTSSLPTSYTVQLFNGSTAVSKVRTFVIDDSFHEGAKIFAYGNSLGGMDFEYFTGLSSLQEDYTLMEANRYVPVGYNPQQGQRTVFGTTQQQKPHASTGWRTKAEHDNIISEFLLADEKYEFINGRYLPIKVDTLSIKKFDIRQRQFAFEFDYQYMFVNQVTGIPASLVGESGDFNNDYLNDFFLQ